MLLLPEKVANKAQKIFERHCKRWLLGEPFELRTISLGVPTEAKAVAHLDLLQRWINVWREFADKGTLEWRSFSWRILGKQTLPIKVNLTSLNQLLVWADKTDVWQLMCERLQRLQAQWAISKKAAIKNIHQLINYNEDDFALLLKALMVLAEPREQSCYLRQLAIPGMSTKWLEKHKGLLSELLCAIKNQKSGTAVDFYSLSNLKPIEALIPFKILDARLRHWFSGMEYLAMPLIQLVKLEWEVKTVFFVENKQTGLTFTDLPGVVVFFGLGYGVTQLASIPWVQRANCYYWGDIDTHGFAILNTLRSFLPNLRSFFMDEKTLITVKAYWGKELAPINLDYLPYLTQPEQEVYRSLITHNFGHAVQFEQEKLSWPYAWRGIMRLALGDEREHF